MKDQVTSTKTFLSYEEGQGNVQRKMFQDNWLAGIIKHNRILRKEKNMAALVIWEIWSLQKMN